MILKNKTDTVRRMVSYLNNYEEQGGMWLPNIQRQFVWSEAQIERLFDSIMREYPISTLLVWKTNSSIKCRKFVDIYKDDICLLDYYIPVNDKQKMLVLDGQQRLQSLYIALKGSYNKKELYFNVFSGCSASSDDTKYEFKFLLEEKADYNWIKLKDIVYTNKKSNQLSKEIISKVENKINRELDNEKRSLIDDNISLMFKVFMTDEIISYQQLDSIDSPELYSDNDIVEIFIRANSGGTQLGKSDLLFSLLVVSWEDAEEKITDLIDELNRFGYSFDRDFILKTCLALIGAGAKYDVEKFRNENNKLKIIQSWDEISDAIRDVKDFVFEHTFLRTDKALSSYTPLIPLMYLRYHFKNKFIEATKKGLNKWLLKVLLTGAFTGSTDTILDRCIKDIQDKKDFDIESINTILINSGRNLKVTDETILSATYGSKKLYLLFNIWYEQFNFMPSYSQNQPQIDHIFPQSVLKKIKAKNPMSGRLDIMKYPDVKRNQLANCMLLSARENGAGGKGDTKPEIWFADKSDDYLKMHFIPQNKSLWSVDKYEEFIEERKKLIVEGFKEVINY